MGSEAEAVDGRLKEAEAKEKLTAVASLIDRYFQPVMEQRSIFPLLPLPLPQVCLQLLPLPLPASTSMLLPSF